MTPVSASAAPQAEQITEVGTNAQPAIGAVPLGSSGCSVAVCIVVNGSGLRVNWIEAYTKDGANLPSGGTGAILWNGNYSNYPGEVVGILPGTSGFLYSYPAHYNFPGKGQVCVEIFGEPGVPCKAVKP